MAIKVTVPDGIDVSACCADATSRFALASVLAYPSTFCGSDICYLLATNGRALSATRAAREGADPAIDKGVLVSPDVLPSRKEKERDVLLNGRSERHDRKGRVLSADYQEGTFPPVGGLVPAVSAETHVAIGLNALLFAQVAAAVSAGGHVTVYVPKDWRKPILLRGSDGLGVLMPVSLGDGGDAAAFKTWTTERDALDAALKGRDATAGRE